MITLTTEQAQQIEEVLFGCRPTVIPHENWNDVYKARAIITAARAQEQAEQEPVEKEIAAAVLDHCYGYSAVNDDMIERTSVVVKKILDKHAAPVHTKDLTDGAIWEILETHPADIITAIRAVIAADREKNK